MTAYPNATWGALVKVNPTERTYVMGGWYNGDVSIRDNEHHGLDWSMRGPLFAIGKLATKSTGFRATEGLIGNYKAGLWYDDSRYTDFNTVARAHSPEPVGGTGASMACSTRCWFGSANMAATVVSASPARSWSLPTNPSVRCLSSPQPASSSAAFFPSRPTDVGGLGVVFGYFSNDLQDSQRRAQQSVQRFETALEATYRLRFLRRCVLFPARPAVHHPAGRYGPHFQRSRGRLPDRGQLLSEAYRQPLLKKDFAMNEPIKGIKLT